MLFSVIIFIIDQIVKLCVGFFIPLNTSITVFKNLFYISDVHNYGAAFSILEGKKVFLVLLGLILITILFLYLRKEKLTNYKITYYSLLIGGILGNMYDRIFHPGVIDFLDFKLFSYDAPIFNLADTFIVVATILIILEGVIKYGNSSREKWRFKNR